jgi:predicted Fe-Mo cluster-binding NifX family protein
MDRTPVTHEGTRVRLGIASADGKVIHQHFGSATQFLIFELEGTQLTFLARRPTDPACRPEGHDPERFQRLLDLVSDCNVVLAAAAGPPAVAALAQRGVRLVVFPDLILNAVAKLFDQGVLITES